MNGAGPQRRTASTADGLGAQGLKGAGPKVTGATHKGEDGAVNGVGGCVLAVPAVRS